MIAELYNRAYRAYVEISSRRSLDKYYKRILRGGVVVNKLSKEQKKEIQDYYHSVIGRNVNTKWHELIYSMSGVFNKRYMPFEIYNDVIFSMSPWYLQKVLDDKNTYRYLLKDFHLPERFLECSYGVYRLPQRGDSEVNLDEASEYLANIDDCIIKPSKDSSSGNKVSLFRTNNGVVVDDGRSVKNFLKSYGSHFVVEKKVIENENLQRLNPSSCNTLRIHTARIDGQVHFLTAFIRIGKKGSAVDNGNKGGICVGLEPSGKIMGETACLLSPYKHVQYTDGGINLNDYKIEGLDRIIDTCISAHHAFPYFDLIGWDMCIDEHDNVVIIEFNPNPDMRLDQLFFFDTCLGQYQEEILKQIYKR